MRFAALFKKELREALPWLLLTLIFFAFFASLILRNCVLYEQYNKKWTDITDINAIVYRFYPHVFFEKEAIGDIGPLLLFSAIGLGIVLGVRQFLFPDFMKTWAYTIHRSINRKTILLAKFLAAIITFCISLGFLWILSYLYSSKEGLFNMPPRNRVFVEGWLFILAGLIVYFGTTLSALSNAKWYTTKTFGFIFSIFVLIISLMQRSLPYNFSAFIIGSVILLSQIFYILKHREF